MSDLTNRFEGLEMNLDNYTFHILGCGAIGSAVASTLSRMGAEHFILYDNDKVEMVNVGVSQYNCTHINRNKVDALSDIILSINPLAKVHSENGLFKEYLYNGKIEVVILGFDSMASRLEAMTIIDKAKWPQPSWVIDGRMGAEQYQQYVIKGPNNLLKSYMKVWYSDKDSSPEPCNLKATAYCSSMAGAFIANAVRKITTKQPYNEDFSFSFPIMRISAFTH
tara:strand:- start:10119 stop:10787 length:669 start_codon:yes stop_codon:yes gene_type:complete